MPDDPTPDPARGEDGKTFTQADLDRIVADRLKREQTKYSDYADLKAKADKLDQLEQANKSEVERAAAKTAEAERRAADAEAKALRLEVAAEKGVKARWLSGTTREELEAAADEYLADHPPAPGDTPPPGRPVEDLRGGGDPDEQPVETNPRKLAESVPRL